MKLNRLNLWTALVSFVASGIWFFTGQVATGCIWLIFSLIWLILAVIRLRSTVIERNPVSRLAHRLSRMLIWG